MGGRAQARRWCGGRHRHGCRVDRLEAAGPLAHADRVPAASGEVASGPRVGGIYARECELSGGQGCRRDRRLSAGPRAGSEASPCRRPARRSGPAATRCEPDPSGRRLVRHRTRDMGDEQMGGTAMWRPRREESMGLFARPLELVHYTDPGVTYPSVKRRTPS